MGRAVVKIRAANLKDVHLQELGISTGAPREVEVEALVDTGATALYLKPGVIEQLGLQPMGTVTSRTAGGRVEQTKYDSVRLEILGRAEVFSVRGIPEECPNLVGQVPLAVLDFVVDPSSQTLIGNPEHGGAWMTDIYWTARPLTARGTGLAP